MAARAGRQGKPSSPTAIERFAGVENVYVAEENDHIEAVAMAVPVTLQGRPGCCLYGLTGQGQPDLGGPCGSPVRAAEAAGRGLRGRGARRGRTGRSFAGQRASSGRSPAVPPAGSGAEPVEPSRVRLRDGPEAGRAAGKALARYRSAPAGADDCGAGGSVLPRGHHRFQQRRLRHLFPERRIPFILWS